MTPADIARNVAKIEDTHTREDLHWFREGIAAQGRAPCPAEVTALHEADKRIGGRV